MLLGHCWVPGVWRLEGSIRCMRLARHLRTHANLLHTRSQ